MQPTRAERRRALRERGYRGKKSKRNGKQRATQQQALRAAVVAESRTPEQQQARLAPPMPPAYLKWYSLKQLGVWVP